MGILERILEGSEERIILKFNKIVDIGLDASKALEKVIEKSDKIDRIRSLEKNSDNVAFEIANEITSGGIAPNLIDTLLELVDKEDNIIDSMYNLAREFHRYKIRNKRLDKYIRGKLIEMNELASEALKIMKKMQKSEKLEEIRHYRREIESLEEKGDDIKDGLFDLAYSNILDFKSFYHIIELAHQADDVLDNCEDSSDIFFTIMSSIVT